MAVSATTGAFAAGKTDVNTSSLPSDTSSDASTPTTSGGTEITSEEDLNKALTGASGSLTLVVTQDFEIDEPITIPENAQVTLTTGTSDETTSSESSSSEASSESTESSSPEVSSQPVESSSSGVSSESTSSEASSEGTASESQPSENSSSSEASETPSSNETQEPSTQSSDADPPDSTVTGGGKTTLQTAARATREVDGDESSATVARTITFSGAGQLNVNGTLTVDETFTITSATSSADTQQVQVGADGQIIVDTGANLTLEGGTVVDGGWDRKTTPPKINHANSMIAVNKGAKLTMKDATVQNFCSYNRGSSLRPGAIYINNGSLLIEKEAVIQYNYIYSDSGIPVGGGVTNGGGTVKMEGGTISNNTVRCGPNSFSLGGGIGMTAEGSVTITGGTIQKNTAELGGALGSYGGSICIEGDAGNEGVTISDNRAVSNEDGIYGYGGAIATFEDASILGNVDIRNNSSDNLGGAIYVNSGAKLKLENVLIRGNHATSLGGGLWSCPVGSVEVYLTNGGAIYDNKADGAGDDFTSMYAASGQAHIWSLSNVMLGGGTASWYNDGGLIPKSEPGHANGDYVNGQPDENAPRYGEDASAEPLAANQLINQTREATLKAIADDGAKTLAAGRATVKITDNEGRYGGGVATNGSVIIGIKTDLTIGKLVSGNDANTEDEFTFQIDLTVPDGETLKDQYYGTVQITADPENPHHGTGTFTLKHGEEVYLSQLPIGTEYTVKETDAKGYTTTWKGTVYQKNDDGSVNPTPVTSGTGTEVSGTTKQITPVTGEDASVIIFTNTKDKEPPPDNPPPPPPTHNNGNLEISKKVTGKGGDANASFTFTVKLTDKNGEPVSGTYSGVTFGADGTAQVTLKGGQSLTLTGIPTGTRYAVTEDKANQDGYTTTATNGSGTITTGTQHASFTNDRGAGDLTVSKTVSGNLDDKNKAFTFTVALDDTSINGTYGGMTFIDGVAEFTLKHGESTTATGLPEGVKYTVVESDNDGYTVTKTGDIGVIVKDETQTAAFENHMDAGDLTVTKTVTGDGDKTKDFTFTVTLSDTSINGTYGEMTFVNGVATFTLRDGGHKTASGLPAGVTYTVAESGNEGYTVTKTGDTGTISADAACVAAFTNDMQKEEETPGTPENPSTPGNPATPQSPANPQNPQNPQNPSTPANSNAPKTGDESHIGLWIAVCGIAAAGVVIVLVTFIARRRRKHVTQNRYL